MGASHEESCAWSPLMHTTSLKNSGGSSRKWNVYVYGAMVHEAGCVFESRMAAVDSPICRPLEKTHLCMCGVGSFMAAVERCRLCMGYVGVFSPKEKLSPRWCLQPMENPTHIMRPYIFYGLCVILFGSKSSA